MSAPDAYPMRMPRLDFSHVRVWVFDLDNTLYPPEAALFSQIEARMTGFVMRHLGVDRDEADHLRRKYWAEYGTTLAGLMECHGIEPDDYLVEVHDISLDALLPDPALSARIGNLPGQRVIHTNGSAPYARRVLAARGLSDVFDAVYGIEHADFQPKPRRAAFEAICARAAITPTNAAMFEDDPRNLDAPHAMGMRTVHVAPQATPAGHIHHHTNDLAGFLTKISA